MSTWYPQVDVHVTMLCSNFCMHVQCGFAALKIGYLLVMQENIGYIIYQLISPNYVT
jgi:hypothetical protein